MVKARHSLYLRSHWLVLLLVLSAFKWDCQIPKDPEKTQERARGGLLKVGLADAPPWSSMNDSGQVDGIEARLIQEFAAQYGTEIAWTPGPQHDLLERLSRFEIDVVIGGLTSTSPWKTKVGFTQPFVVLPDSADPKRSHEHVIAVPPGENGFLMSLDKFLKSKESDIRQTFPEAKS